MKVQGIEIPESWLHFHVSNDGLHGGEALHPGCSSCMDQPLNCAKWNISSLERSCVNDFNSFLDFACCWLPCQEAAQGLGGNCILPVPSARTKSMHISHYMPQAATLTAHTSGYWEVSGGMWELSCAKLFLKSLNGLCGTRQNLRGRTWVSPFPELCHLLKEMQQEPAPLDWMGLQTIGFSLAVVNISCPLKAALA